MEARKAFIEDLQRGEESFAELCRRHGISRRTGYKWKRRHKAAGEAGLADQSRAPKRQAQAASPAIRERIVAVKRSHMTWGPRKIQQYLSQREPAEAWPASSTMGELLRREGLVIPRQKRRRTPPHSAPLAHADQANRVWTTDFKGWFLVGNGERCNPITVQDAYSRFLLRVRHLPKTDTAHALAIYEMLFRTYGLPDAMRSDNGPPFATTAPGGLSRLSMFWIRLGIRHERIDPGCPEQNGRLERTHLTLLQDTASPPAYDLFGQQERFADYEHCFSFERPHEALGGATPASLYVPSTRPYPSAPPSIVYPDDYLLRRVANKGDLNFKGERTFLSELLAHETIGLRPVDDHLFEVYWATVLLGWFDGRSHCFVPERSPQRRPSRRSSSPEAEPRTTSRQPSGLAPLGLDPAHDSASEPNNHPEALPLTPLY